MATEFNIGVANKWFLGEDKTLSFTIFAVDGITPIDFSAWTIEFVFRRTDKTTDLKMPIKTFVNGGLHITGVFNVDPAINTQRLIISFPSDDTTSLKAGYAYRYSIKRTDVNNEEILAYGSITFLQA